jgi:hypothetical protein
MQIVYKNQRNIAIKFLRKTGTPLKALQAITGLTVQHISAICLTHKEG